MLVVAMAKLTMIMTTANVTNRLKITTRDLNESISTHQHWYYWWEPLDSNKMYVEFL